VTAPVTLRSYDRDVNGSVATFWSLADWAEAVAALPAGGPLPCRTVLVPGEPLAHALRRALVESGRTAALAGTRFVTLGEAAPAVLRAAGVAFEPGEDDLRPVRLLGLFAEPLPLEYFSAELLRDRPGWDLALAQAVTDLEAVGLRPEALEAADEPRLRDVARIWRWLDARAGRSWTTARTVAEAAEVLAREPRRWPYPGPALAAVTGHESRAEARLVRAVPDLALGVLAARPLRERHLDRVEPPRVLADPDRPRSPGPDDTVRLEEHAGVEAELEATADWVAEQVADGTPLEDIAVLLPSLDPLAALVAARLARLPWPAGDVGGGPVDARTAAADVAGVDGAESRAEGGGADTGGASAAADGADDDAAGTTAARSAGAGDPGPGTLPVHVAGGLPLASTAAGARALAVVRALAAHLSGEALAGVLPALRTAPDADARDTDARHLTHGEATELVWSLGTPGGNPAHPEGALDWPARLAAREPALQALLARARAARDDPERSGLARTARDLERLLGSLRAARPAVEALAGVARLVVARRRWPTSGPRCATSWPPGSSSPWFGATVHQAIGLLLREPALGPAQAVRIAAALTGLAGGSEGAASQPGPPGAPGETSPGTASLLAEAAADVARAWHAVAAEGLARSPGPDLRLEYPVAGPGPEGTLIAGYADLVAVTGDRVDVLDFKTDPPPPGPVESAHPEYVRQVRLYADLLGSAGLLSGRRLRCGLLFTGDGRIWWLEEGSRR
jgi:hypothetical protein